MKKRSVITELMDVTAPLGSALASESSKLYVINNQQSEVSVIDTTSNTVLRSLPIGCLNPIDIKVDAKLHKAFATKSSCSEVAVIDTRTDAVSMVITLPGGPPRRPQFLVIDPISHRAYVSVTWGSDEDGLSGGVAILDTSNNSIVGGIELGENPSRLALDVSEHRLYVVDRRGESVSVIDTQSDVVLGEIPVGSDPTDIAIVPAGRSNAN
jgi:YVTN family beta-propeller protein